MTRSKVFVSELTDNSAVETTFLAAAKSVRETRNGDPYLCITLQDKTGTIEARGWDDAEQLEARFDADDFIAVRGRVSSYRGELQITVNDVERIDDSRVELSDYLPHSRWSRGQLFDALRSLVQRHVNSEEIRRFLFALLDDDAWSERFSKAPAAVSNHHAYLAGLLEHTLSMARLAVTMGRHYSAYYPGLVDPDLLVAGCVIHDMGKIDELEYRRSFDYSTRGRLVGHVVGGAELVGRVARTLEPELDEQLTMQLQHLVLSHHGKKDYGAPVTPKSPEAILLHHLDMIDSRMNACWQACKPLVEGDDDGEGWSDYQRMFGSSMYVSGDAAQGWQQSESTGGGADGPGIEPGGVAPTEQQPDARASSPGPRDEAGDDKQSDVDTETTDDQTLTLFDD